MPREPMSQWYYPPASPTPRYAYLPQNAVFPQDPRPLPATHPPSSPPKPPSLPHGRPLPTPLPRSVKSQSLDMSNIPHSYLPPTPNRAPLPPPSSFVPYWKRDLPGPADMSRRSTVSGPAPSSIRRPLPASPTVTPTVPSDKHVDRPPSPQYGILDLPLSRSAVEQRSASVVNGPTQQPISQSVTYKMASMSLDNNKRTWPSSLPPLPRAPAKHQVIDLDDAPPPSLRRSQAPVRTNPPQSLPFSPSQSASSSHSPVRAPAARPSPSLPPSPSQSKQQPASVQPSLSTFRDHAVRPSPSFPSSHSQSRQPPDPQPSFRTHAVRPPQSAPPSPSQSTQSSAPSLSTFRTQPARSPQPASTSSQSRQPPAPSQPSLLTFRAQPARPPQSASTSPSQSRQSSVPSQPSLPTFRTHPATPQTPSVSTNRSHNPIPQRTAIPKISFPGNVDSDSDNDGPTISVSIADNDIPIPSISFGNNPQSSRPRSVASLPTIRRTGGLSCGGCGGAIIGRIVSAIGVRWHPECFKCCVCNELLENLSSYEKDGRPYCHLDYHEAYAPKCYHCNTTIVDEQFITLNDHELGRRTYHEQHFFCAECGDPFLPPSSGNRSFAGDGAFEDDDVGFTVYKGHPYCESCHVRLRMPKCKKCKKSIRDGMKAVEALGGKWCWECFVCAGCDQPFENPSFFQRDDYPFCERCFSIIIRNEL